jgi:hypothetical protein
MQKLANAADDARQKIGEGLLAAMAELGGENGIGLVTNAIDDLASGLSESIVSTAKLITELEKLPVLGDFLGRLFSNPLNLPKEFLTFGKGGLLDSYRAYGKVAGLQKATDNAHLKSLNDQFKVIRKTGDVTTKLTADELKKLKAKQLQLAIDKANLALGKGESIFDMDKIQVAAALTSQAEQLGKATSSAQMLQIANDTARLNVKKSMLDLEDAIAAKDTAAIVSATAKLNADLRILSALTGQNVKLQDIQSILDGFKPKELIDQENLNLALFKIKQMLDLLGQASTASKANIPTSGSLGSGITPGDFINPVAFDPSASIGAILEYADAATERANAFALLQEQQNYADYLSLIEFQKKLGDFGGYSSNMNTGRGYGAGSTEVIVTIEDKTSGLIEVVQNAVQQNNRFGNNLNFAGALPV